MALMTDETNIPTEEDPPVEDVRFVAPDPVPEPYEWYKAFKNGESIGEGPAPIPDDIRIEATEIRWSNPSKDKTFTPDPEPVSPEVLKNLQDETPVKYTPPAEAPDKPSMARVDPNPIPDNSNPIPDNSNPQG